VSFLVLERIAVALPGWIMTIAVIWYVGAVTIGSAAFTPCCTTGPDASA